MCENIEDETTNFSTRFNQRDVIIITDSRCVIWRGFSIDSIANIDTHSNSIDAIHRAYDRLNEALNEEKLKLKSKLLSGSNAIETNEEIFSFSSLPSYNQTQHRMEIDEWEQNEPLLTCSVISRNERNL